MVKIEIETQGEAMGDITADLAGRRGRVSDTNAAANGHMIISALVPLSELDDYSSRLKAITAGEGSYEISFSHYDPVPGNIQQTLTQQYQQQLHEGE